MLSSNILSFIQQPRTIQSLPDDVVLVIAHFLNIKTILALRRTCKAFYRLTKLRWLWTDIIKREIIANGIPLPALKSGFMTLSAVQLESRVIHAAKLLDNWHSPQPKPRRTIEFQLDAVNDDKQPPKVKQVLFLPGRSGTFLVTLAGGYIACWEVPLDGTGAYQVAQWVEDNGVEQIVVNQDPNHDVEIAYRSPHPTDPARVVVYTLSLDTFHGRFVPRYALCALRAQVTPLHMMHGDKIILGERLLFWYYEDTSAPGGSIRAIERYVMSESRAIQGRNSIMTMKSIGSYVLVVCEREIASIRFRGVVQDATIIARSLDKEDTHREWPSEGVSVLLHLDDAGFSVLRRYDFPPNTEKKPVPQRRLVMPCIVPIGCTREIGVPPSACRLTSGRSGKGFWVQTCNIEDKHCRYPARCIIGFDTFRPGSFGNCTSACKGAKASNRAELYICPGQLYARKCNMGEIMRKDYRSICAADIEDILGRIAVGDSSGKVEVLDFV